MVQSRREEEATSGEDSSLGGSVEEEQPAAEAGEAGETGERGEDAGGGAEGEAEGSESGSEGSWQ
jgi:hypothetical protein